MANNHDTIKVAFWNSQSIYNKTAEVHYFLTKHKIDVLLINETWLAPNKNIYIAGYNCIKKDRLNNIGGGVAIIIKKNIKYCTVPQPPTITMEHITISIKTNNDEEIYMTSLYNKPQNKLNTNELEEIMKQNTKIIVAGDYNAHNTIWNCRKTNTNGTSLEQICLRKNWIIEYPDTPTHYSGNAEPSTIDLAVVKGLHITKPISLPELPSNHNPVIFEIRQQKLKTHNKKLYDYTKADWKHFRHTLNSNIYLPPDIQTNNAIDTAVRHITELIKQASTESIPLKTEISQNHVPANIKSLIHSRNVIRRQWQRSRQLHLKEEMRQLTTKIKRELKNYQNEIWKLKLSRLDNKDHSLWKKLHQLKGKSTLVDHLTNNNLIVTRDKEKANLLADTFEKVHELTKKLFDKTN